MEEEGEDSNEKTSDVGETTPPSPTQNASMFTSSINPAVGQLNYAAEPNQQGLAVSNDVLGAILQLLTGPNNHATHLPGLPVSALPAIHQTQTYSPLPPEDVSQSHLHLLISRLLTPQEPRPPSFATSPQAILQTQQQQQQQQGLSVLSQWNLVRQLDRLSSSVTNLQPQLEMRPPSVIDQTAFQLGQPTLLDYTGSLRQVNPSSDLQELFLRYLSALLPQQSSTAFSANLASMPSQIPVSAGREAASLHENDSSLADVETDGKPHATSSIETTAGASFHKHASLDASMDGELFPQKLYRLINDLEEQGERDIIDFESDNKTIRIHDQNRFMNEIVPIYFRHGMRLASFRRQLNMYGFQRTSWGANGESYEHPRFLKGKPELLVDVKRSDTRTSEKDSTTRQSRSIKSTNTVRFPEKLLLMLCESEEKTFDDIVSFFPGGEAFKVHDPKEFEKKVLGLYFRHGKMKSFRRQLHHYGFKRIPDGTQEGGYMHPFFRRDRPELLRHVVRDTGDEKRDEDQDG